jgi:hypothetical protein
MGRQGSEQTKPCQAFLRMVGLILAVSSLLLPIMQTAHAQEIRSSQMMQVIGMPGSLGIAGLDAMTEFCTGSRAPTFRTEALAFVEEHFSQKDQVRFTKFYDKRYADWREKFGLASYQQNKDKTCSDNNFKSAKSPDRNLWARFATTMGYPGF